MKPNHKGKAQIFENPLLEKLTRTNSGLPISIFVVISAGLIYYGITHSFISVLEAVGLFLAGWFAFTLLEYLAHRYLFHMSTDTPTKARIQYTFHGNHHEYPKDKERLAMPPIVSVFIASFLFFVFKLVFGNFVFGIVAGMLFGYALYLFVHYAVHAYAPPKNFLKTLWIHHSIHHYKDPNAAYGVSSPLWDYIMGTMPKRSR
ncbi:sterol desaturase family protein [Pontibacter sp. 172403-2]|uniref:sterol desaturase family protein n=1 Tax=Pontibacter rufus TaxID=2791028 RepID=UPI0018AFBD1C|nr:sterol desaturase family protein [Pontibacter sp. 172403-2]MBF9252870.1 sterol desaturase family protein [Pontibacter sp. 172403-2]